VACVGGSFATFDRWLGGLGDKLNTQDGDTWKGYAWKRCMIVFLLVLGMEEMISLAIICVRDE
jgi:hypothetical protein